MAVGLSPAAYSYYGGPETGPQKTTEPLVNTNPIPSGGEAKIQVMNYSYRQTKKKAASFLVNATTGWTSIQEPGIGQGPLKNWTEYSLELHLLKIHSRGGSYYTPGLDGG